MHSSNEKGSVRRRACAWPYFLLNRCLTIQEFPKESLRQKRNDHAAVSRFEDRFVRFRNRTSKDVYIFWGWYVACRTVPLPKNTVVQHPCRYRTVLSCVVSLSWSPEVDLLERRALFAVIGIYDSSFRLTFRWFSAFLFNAVNRYTPSSIYTRCRNSGQGSS